MIPLATTFLPAAFYGCAAVARQEWRHYIGRFWQPLLPVAALPLAGAQAIELAGRSLLITQATGQGVQVFVNRCPHRGVAFLPEKAGARPCRKLICPYHGWTYGLDGRLLAAAREADYGDGFDRRAWDLEPVPCQVVAGMIWIALGLEPLPLEQQLDLVLEEAQPLLEQPRVVLGRHRQTLACNWKIAHDNTLDDYHVAIAHPATLHREQGPVRLYRHRLGGYANLLATPWPSSASGTAEFLTFGLPPWNHLLLWPDGRLAVISFVPQSLTSCQLELWLLGEACWLPQADRLLQELRSFLAEDQALVESAQQGYATLDASGEASFRPGPPHRLEQRILHHQGLYTSLMPH